MPLHKTLRNHAFMQGLTEEQTRRLATLATEVTFEPDEVILRNGQHSEFFHLIVSGSVAVELTAAPFRTCVEALGPDQIFGWSALLDDQDTLFQVRAREHTVALRIGGAQLVDACRTDVELGVELFRRTLRVVAGRVRATEIKFAEMCGVRL